MQDLVILMNATDIHEIVVRSLKDKVGDYSVRYINKSTEDTVVEKLAVDRPFFSDYFVVEVVVEKFDERKLQKLLKKLVTYEHCKFIILTSNIKDYELCQSVFTIRDAEHMSCYLPPESVFEAYVKLNCRKTYTLKAKDMLYKRLRGQFNLISDYLRVFEDSDSDIIDERFVARVVPKAVKFRAEQLLISFITGEDLKRNLKTMYNYKYASKYVLTRLDEVMDLTLTLKLDYINGKLRRTNLAEYASENNIRLHTLETLFNKLILHIDSERLYYHKMLIRKYSKNSDGLLMLFMEAMK